MERLQCPHSTLVYMSDLTVLRNQTVQHLLQAQPDPDFTGAELAKVNILMCLQRSHVVIHPPMCRYLLFTYVALSF